MNDELLAEVQRLLEGAGYGSGSGLSTDSDGDTVLVAWHVDSLIRPTIAAHATDADLHAAVSITGIRTALDTALTSVFAAAGLCASVRSHGVIAVTRRATRLRPLRCLAGSASLVRSVLRPGE
ncbi:hypothetical protein ACFT0G_32480 [Streptomyces sp. NPDC057020]|uniref:hypothetical protein n=1 Tax=unclassified Streptomyces TaxID=2593676 RepID=UPI003629F440